VAQIEQYKTNVQDAMSWLEITESAVANVGDILQRARELAVQASSGTTTEEDTKKIKQEVEQLKNQLIKIANSTYAGRYIFSGFKTNTRLMDDDGYFTMDVANSEAIIYQIGISDSININVPGGDLFNGGIDAGAGGKGKLIADFEAYINALDSGDHSLISDAITNIDENLNHVLRIRADIGARYNRLESTIMMNQIASAVILYLVDGPFNGVRGEAQSFNLRTPYLKPTAVFPSLHNVINSITGLFGFEFPHYVAVDLSWLIALIVVLLMWFVLFKTSFGLRVRWVGQNISASVYAGVDVKKTLLVTMLISGAIGGLVGLQEVAYISKFFTPNITRGLGFTGLAVALLARNNPLGVILSGLLFSFLSRAGYGLQMYTKVPNSLIGIISGL